jgi:hypothetical protein
MSDETIESSRRQRPLKEFFRGAVTSEKSSTSAIDPTPLLYR